jgi:hypothetical protein
MEATTASADTPLVRVRVRELEHPEADDQVVALSAHLRPGTADLAGAIAASAAGCQTIELDSAVTRSDARRFYARVGLPISAFHFSRPLAAGYGRTRNERD